jgi:DNA-binding HxlR family transcriptional regulator
MERDLKAATTRHAPVPRAPRQRRESASPHRNGHAAKLVERSPAAGPNGSTPTAPAVNGQPPVVARTRAASTQAIELVGKRWSLLILREAFLGVRRFRDLEESLGIPRKTLARRLRELVESGLLERRHYAADRYEYWLTESGRGLYPTLRALDNWGESYLLS